MDGALTRELGFSPSVPTIHAAAHDGILQRSPRRSRAPSEARQRLFPLIEEVTADPVAVEIVSKKGTPFLVSADEYRSLEETVHLLQSPANARRLRESVAKATAGAVESHDLVE